MANTTRNTMQKRAEKLREEKLKKTTKRRERRKREGRTRLAAYGDTLSRLPVAKGLESSCENGGVREELNRGKALIWEGGRAENILIKKLWLQEGEGGPVIGK